MHLDPHCFATILDRVDSFATCERYVPIGESSPRCPIYTADHDVGEPCTARGYHPPISECRAGLECRGDSAASNPQDWPSEDDPGTCAPATTKPAEPCLYVTECAAIACFDGYCYFPPPPVCSALDEWADRLDPG